MRQREKSAPPIAVAPPLRIPISEEAILKCRRSTSRAICCCAARADPLRGAEPFDADARCAAQQIRNPA